MIRRYSNFGIRYFLTALACMSASGVVHSQPHESIAITARPCGDSITLRWAPLTYECWQMGNRLGYTIERYTITRNGVLLKDREKRTLHTSVKPIDETGWEQLAAQRKYAAIAAQALFGNRFEIDLKNSDAFSIVNKVQENEQRFAFALFCADMSAEVAHASGLLFSDPNIEPGVKYLYRISINTADSLKGSVFISPDDPYVLPRPGNLTANSNDGLVSLKWDKSNHAHYTAYTVERSMDGQHFTPVSEAPLVTVSPTEMKDTRYVYAVDSLPDKSMEVFYRVKGLTPFGEAGPPSESVHVRPRRVVKQVPYILSAESTDNQTIEIKWSFPEENNNGLSGFMVERASAPQERFTSLAPTMLPAKSRTYKDRTPLQANYYRVTAVGMDGSRYPSPVSYGQLVDSIPPAPPDGLQASIDEKGMVTLSWNANNDPDIYGYRVYKANYKSEEPAQVTTSPIVQSSFSDHVNLNTLNDHVYYRVMAIDKNQNHSALSELITVSLPDRVPPRSPVIHTVKSQNTGVALSWEGAGEDVTQYRIYRKALHETEWRLIKVIPTDTDTASRYTDTSVGAEPNFYTILSVDEAGNESAPAAPVSGRKINNVLHPAVQWKRPIFYRDDNQVALRWVSPSRTIRTFRIYKSVRDDPPVLYKTLPGTAAEFRDTLRPTVDYTYRILAILDDNSKSAISEPLFVDY